MTDVKERPSAALHTRYEDDFYLWTQEQAALLLQRRFDELDEPNLIDEIESMGSEKRRALQSSYRVLIIHLLKWGRQPARRSRSWTLTINRERENIEDVEEESPSLAKMAADLIPRAYQRARREASIETGIPEKAFPPDCPFTLAQLRDDEFLPD